MRPTNLLTGVLTLIVICGASPVVSAANVSLVYIGGNPIDVDGRLTATPGDLLTFDIIWDFRDTPTIGGSFDIVFNPDALVYESHYLAPICNDPDCYGAWAGFDLGDGRFSDWAYGSIQPIDDVLNMGSITFEFVAHDFSQPFLYGAPSNGIGGPFISGVDYISVIDVTYNEVSLAPVPLPGAVWLLLGAFGALGAFRARYQAHDEMTFSDFTRANK